MNRCRQCGAILPENSAVCIHCGTDNTTQQARPVESAPPADLDYLKPALTGGVPLGVLAAIPVVNCLCCIWVLGSGALATWQLDKQRPGTLKYGDGAIAGGLSGVVGGIVATLVGIPVQRLFMTPERVLVWIERFVPNIPLEQRNQIVQSLQPTVSGMLIQAVVNICLYGLFALAGGCLMVAILNRNKTD